MFGAGDSSGGWYNATYLEALDKAQKGKLTPSQVGQFGGLTDAHKSKLLQAIAAKNAPAGPMVPGGVPGYGVPFAPGMTPPGVGGAPGAPGGGPGGAGAGGYGGTIYGQLLNQFQTAQDEAKAANQKRYDQVLAEQDALKTRTLGGLEGLGNSARAGIKADYAGLGSRLGQDLVSRGLANTTVGAQQQLGVAEKQNTAIQALEEQLRRERLGYDVNLTGDKLGFIERRDDTYPDMGQLAQLAQGLGTSGYGNAMYTPAPGVGAPALQTPGSKPIRTKTLPPGSVGAPPPVTGPATIPPGATAQARGAASTTSPVPAPGAAPAMTPALAAYVPQSTTLSDGTKFQPRPVAYTGAQIGASGSMARSVPTRPMPQAPSGGYGVPLNVPLVRRPIRRTLSGPPTLAR